MFFFFIISMVDCVLGWILGMVNFYIFMDFGKLWLNGIL